MLQAFHCCLYCNEPFNLWANIKSRLWSVGSWQLVEVFENDLHARHLDGALQHLNQCSLCLLGPRSAERKRSGPLAGLLLRLWCPGPLVDLLLQLCIPFVFIFRIAHVHVIWNVVFIFFWNLILAISLIDNGGARTLSSPPMALALTCFSLLLSLLTRRRCLRFRCCSCFCEV